MLLLAENACSLSLSRYKDTPQKIDLTLGDWDLKATNDGPHLKVNVASVKVHPSYSRATLQNDVAVLKLTSKIVYQDNIKPICLPATGESITIFRTCMQCYITISVGIQNYW